MHLAARSTCITRSSRKPRRGGARGPASPGLRQRCTAAVVMRLEDWRHQRCAIDWMARDHHRNPIDLGETVWRQDCFRLTDGHDCSVRQEGYTGGTEGSMIQIV